MLSKGLSFAPTNHANTFQTKIDLFKFYRTLHLKTWHHLNASTTQRMLNDYDAQVRPSKEFRPRSTFCPVVNNASLIAFTKKVSCDMDTFLQSVTHSPKANLSKPENAALRWLSNNDNLVIKKADKGGAVVVWGREQYVQEALSQLGNAEYYTALQSSPIEYMKRELEEILNNARMQGWITDLEKDFLLNNNPKIPTFYMLPKVHKNLENPPGRPIISGIDSISEPPSQYIDYYIKSLVHSLPSYIQDTTYVLNKINDIKNIGEGYMATMDVTSLYSNIKHQDGLEAVSHYLQSRTEEHPPNTFILELMKWILNNNVFVFQENMFRQKRGTAMGATFAPNYACLFLGLWEEKFIWGPSNIYRDNIIFYGRYIDDLVFFYNGDQQSLKDMHQYLNSTSDSVELSLDYSQSEIHFLDLKITKSSSGDLHTTIFRKDTDRNTTLHAESCHPPHLIENIPFGQLQRLRRICDKEDDFDKKAGEMTARFRERGYKENHLQTAYRRVKSMDRRNLLQKTQRTQHNSNVYFVTKYSKQYKQICNIIKKNWHILHGDPILLELFPNLPSFASRRAPTLQDKLVQSHLGPKTSWLQKPKGTYPCGHCCHCENISKSNTFVDIFNQKTYKMNHFANCNTKCVVYRLECPCGHFYIGRTKRRFKDRLGEHKTAIRTKNQNYAMAVHYEEAGHVSPSSLRAVVLEVVPHNIRGGDRVKKLLQRETFWIVTLQATKLPGLNDEVDFLPFL